MPWTDSQKRAIETTGRGLCVDAAAGSGKTSVLVERVLHLVKEKRVSLDRIVAITFTDKAAAEMKDRLREECRKRETLEDAAEMTWWRSLARKVETARMSTIHSFCASLLRENALTLGDAMPLDPDFGVLDEAQSRLLRRDLVHETLLELLENGDDAAFRLATHYTIGRLEKTLGSLLARPGVMAGLCADPALESPETLVDAWRRRCADAHQGYIAGLRDSADVWRLQRLLESFEGKCGNPDDGREELRQRMLTLLGEMRDGLDVRATECKAQGFLAEKSKNGAKKNWESEDVYKALSKAQDSVKEFLGSLLDWQGDEDVERMSAALTCDLVRVYGVLAARFAEAKRARNALDFDDLIMGALTMLRKNEEIRDRVARGIDHLLIDEFQDTDSEQYEMATILAEAPEAPEIFIVGDAKQSIYRFRGAEVEVFRKAQDDKEIIRLDDNFRTVPDVLEFVNDFFASTGLLSLVEPAYRPIRAARPTNGDCRIRFMIPHEIEGGRVADYRRAEADMIASWIAGVCSSDAVRVGQKGIGETRPAHPGDIALLLRAMSDVAIYERSLRERNIPYRVVAGKGFYERQEVLDVRNLLKVVCDPWDEIALAGFLRSPIAGMSDESLVRLCAGSGLAGVFMGDGCPVGFDQEDALAAARALILELRRSNNRPLPEFMRHVLDLTAYEAMLAQLFLGEQRVCNVRKIVELARDFSATSQPCLSAFVRYLDEVAAVEVNEGDAPIQADSSDEVTIMSIHKSKGLEYPIVILPDLARAMSNGHGDDVLADRALGIVAKPAAGCSRKKGEGGLAIRDAIMRQDRTKDLAERARLMYVAMTRARDWLLLAGSPAPPKDSWLEVFDLELSLSGRIHGARLSGRGWSAKVLREVADARLDASEGDVQVVTDRSTIERRMGELPVSAPERRTFSVSEIAEAICGDSHSLGPREFAHDPEEADPLVKGTLVHRLFETWDFKGCAPPDVDAFMIRECPSSKARSQLTQYISSVVDRFRGSDLMRRLAAEARIQREAPFLLRVGDALVSGVVDMCLSDGTIVDYKTGRPNPASARRYECQIRLYAAAVRGLLGKEPPAAFLYYVDADELRVVDISPDTVGDTLRRAEGAVVMLRAREQGCGQCQEVCET